MCDHVALHHFREWNASSTFVGFISQAGAFQLGARALSAKEGSEMTRYLASPKGWFGLYDLFGAARAVLGLMKNVVQRIENRRAVTDLLEWDNHALKDIGLTRADVHLALGLPFSKDPSQRLNDWAHERRSARLAREDSCEDLMGRPQLRVVGRSRSTTISISRR